MLVARTEVDAVMDDKGSDTFILVKALNEYDTKAVDWRKKVREENKFVGDMP